MGRASGLVAEVVPVHIRVQEGCSGPDGNPAGMGVPHRVGRPLAPGPVPGLRVTPSARPVFTRGELLRRRSLVLVLSPATCPSEIVVPRGVSPLHHWLAASN